MIDGTFFVEFGEKGETAEQMTRETSNAAANGWIPLYPFWCENTVGVLLFEIKASILIQNETLICISGEEHGANPWIHTASFEAGNAMIMIATRRMNGLR
jgi:hypothetical protein